MLGCRAAPAANAQHRNARHNVQHLPGRGQRQCKISAAVSCRQHTGGRCALYRPIRGKMHAFSRQQCTADLLDALRFGHNAALPLGPLVHRKKAVQVCGGRDDRHRTAHRRQPPRQRIGAAQMPGQQRNGEPPALIQHHHGGICGLAAAVRRDGPHCDPHCADINQRV